MEIQITIQRAMKEIAPGEIRRKLRKILNDSGLHNVELSILLTDDKQIEKLNYRFLKRKGPTNVLAFPMKSQSKEEPESLMLGDIVISLDSAKRESENTGENVIKIVDRLLVHGYLHLLGHDHEKSNEEARKMEKETERLLAIMEG